MSTEIQFDSLWLWRCLFITPEQRFTEGCEGILTKERYFQWMRVWHWFAADKDSEGSLGGLHDMLNVLWQEERKNSTTEELIAHSEAWYMEDGFQKLARDIDTPGGR